MNDLNLKIIAVVLNVMVAVIMYLIIKRELKYTRTDVYTATIIQLTVWYSLLSTVFIIQLMIKLGGY